MLYRIFSKHLYPLKTWKQEVVTTVKFSDPKSRESWHNFFQISTWTHAGHVIEESCEFKGGSLSR